MLGTGLIGMYSDGCGVLIQLSCCALYVFAKLACSPADCTWYQGLRSLHLYFIDVPISYSKWSDGRID